MLHIFHGEDILASRKELEALRKKYQNSELIVLNGKKITLVELQQALTSATLFGGERLVIIENLLSKFGRAHTKEFDRYLQILNSSIHEVVLWEEKEIGKILLKKFPEKIDIAIFKLTQILFRFLETLAPHKTTQSLVLLEEVLTTESAELVLYMLYRQLRLLLLYKRFGVQGVVELAPWQKSKLQSQAATFTLEQLLSLYQNLFEIELRIKTGESPFTLAQELQQWIVKI